ncbi:MAG: IS200/IS605 family transposase, partial [archaeon]
MEQRKLDSNKHSVFLLYYHLILVVKYRKNAITKEIGERLREIFEDIGRKYHIEVEEWNFEADHIHALFRTRPSTCLAKFTNAYKSASSRL